MNKHTKFNPESAVVRAFDKKIFAAHYTKEDKQHHADMYSVIDRMFDAHQPFTLTITRNDTETIVVQGDFDLADDSNFNVTAEVTGFDGRNSRMTSCDLGLCWWLHVHFDDDGNVTHAEPVINTDSVERIVCDLIKLARRKKDKSHLKHATRRIHECERVQGKEWAATPRKAIFGRIATAEAWIDRQKPSKGVIWRIADEIVARIGADATPEVENAIPSKCWVAFDKGGLSFRLGISTCPRTKKITVSLVLDRKGGIKKLPHYEILLEQTYDTETDLCKGIGEGRLFHAEVHQCITRGGEPKERALTHPEYYEQNQIEYRAEVAAGAGKMESCDEWEVKTNKKWGRYLQGKGNMASHMIVFSEKPNEHGFNYTIWAIWPTDRYSAAGLHQTNSFGVTLDGAKAGAKWSRHMFRNVFDDVADDVADAA